MPPDLAPLLALVGLGTFGLIGMRMWLRHKIERSRLAGSEEVDKLVDVIDRLHDQIQVVREDLGDLQERIDFAERMLTRGDEGADAEE
jgi:hypothetical protein